MAVQRTTIPKKSQIEKKFYLVDAEGKTLGRLASRVASILRGKNKATFTPHMDTGDNVIIINAEKVRVTGRKATDKTYDRYSGFHSGLKSIPFEKMIARRPRMILQLAITRMLPKGKLGDNQKANLFVYDGAAHPHQAQKPVVLDI
jgi:large subunit ribosomal protein L13